MGKRVAPRTVRRVYGDTLKIKRYKLNFVCPGCKELSDLEIIDTCEVASHVKGIITYLEVPNDYNSQLSTYTEFFHNTGVCQHTNCGIDYDTLQRVRIECANCGWVLPEAEERETFHWLKENNYLEEVNGGD